MASYMTVIDMSKMGLCNGSRRLRHEMFNESYREESIRDMKVYKAASREDESMEGMIDSSSHDNACSLEYILSFQFIISQLRR